MISKFLLLRFKQIYRAIIAIGIFRALILTGLIVLTGSILFIQSSKLTGALIISALNALTVLYIHLKRKDHLFLRSRFKNNRLILTAEYSLYSIPVLISLLYHMHFIYAAALPGLFFLISFINKRSSFRSLNTVFQRIIPEESFEWKAGSRKLMFIIIPLWITGFATSFFVGSIPLIIILLGLIPLGFYDTAEPYQMIIAYEKSTNKFLKAKIFIQILIFSALSLPLIICYIFLHFEYWYIPLAEYVLLISLQIYFITAKYAFYEPNEKSSTAQLYGAFGALSIFVPFLIPFVWIMSIYFYYKSKRKLKVYLNDYN